MGWDDENDKGGKGPWGSREPKGEKPKSPWGQQNQPPGDEPPDLEEVLRQAQDRFGSVFGGKPDHEGRKGLGLLFIVLFLLWLGTGFYRVEPGENAVLLTFGKYSDTRATAGLGYHIPWPVQSVQAVDVAFDRRIEIGFRNSGRPMKGEQVGAAAQSSMLTGDENIVDINYVIMWKIGDARKYLFEIRDPETTVKKVAESAMREVIARSPIQKALTEGRADIEAQTKALLQSMLDEYQSGIVVNNVQLLSVDPPAPVVDAFDDVQRARADKERTKNEAETYRNDIVPRARGDAQKLLQDAEAYKQAVLSKAQGEAARFDSVYAAYAVAKDVTAKRLYIETMQQVMKNSKKVVMSEKSGAFPYLSLDRLENRPKAQAAATSDAAQ